MTLVRAVIYCRVSTKEQTHNLSIPTQLKACREYCQRHGLAIAKEFLEQGESAKTADRTQLQLLLAYCRENKGQVQALVVYNISRFARDRYDHVVVRAQLQKLGVTLRSVSEPIDDSSVGKLMEGIVSAVAQFDNDQKAERTAAGMQAALTLGRWTFKAPLGYLNNPTRTGPSLIDQKDVEGVLGFAEYLMTNAGRVWQEASLIQRQQIQRAIFPEGLPFNGQEFGTAPTCLAFSGLLGNSASGNDMASPHGSAQSRTIKFLSDIA